MVESFSLFFFFAALSCWANVSDRCGLLRYINQTTRPVSEPDLLFNIFLIWGGVICAFDLKIWKRYLVF